MDPFDFQFGSQNIEGYQELVDSGNAQKFETTSSKHKTLGRVTHVKPYISNPRKRKYGDLIEKTDDIILRRRPQVAANNALPRFSELQEFLAPRLFNYEDLLFGARSAQNSSEIREVTVLHALNHIFKTRDLVIKHNAKAHNKSNKAITADTESRDQGFTRPKVLILVETRQQCVKYVEAIVKFSDPDQQENRKRFLDGFSGNEYYNNTEKPEDFRELFEGNNDSDFRLGVKFTRKAIKYHSPFYDSDIIFASALGLRRAIKPDKVKETDYDFLSSIEICVIDQADAMLMQNWEHVEFALKHLNEQPRESHGCDFSRVRQWYLDGLAKFIRQTIVFAAYLTPELNALFNQHMSNIAGKWKVAPEYRSGMLNLDTSIRQTFVKYTSKSAISDPDDRFKHFTSIIMPLISRTPFPAEGGLGILLFIPKYYDFVRIRNFFGGNQLAQDVPFGTISEYTEQSEMQRAKSHFMSGRLSVLLYTGRAHHFRRTFIREVKQVYFYGLPENPIFYKELVEGFIGNTIHKGKTSSRDAKSTALFSKWDALTLERIVGTGRVSRMLKEDAGDTFDFL